MTGSTSSSTKSRVRRQYARSSGVSWSAMRKKSVPRERPIVSYMSVPLLAVEDVGSRRLHERPQAAAAELLGGGPRGAGPFGQPGRRVGPPGAGLRLGALEPLG